MLFLLISTLLLINCKKKTTEQTGCPMFDNVTHSPHAEPIWHPDGKVIGYNHEPISAIYYEYGEECPRQARYIYDYENAGFWLVNSDGSDPHRILPYSLRTASWSPDGKWIAFSDGGQITVMPFDGEKFDESKKIQLTSSGNNSYPAWNKSGNKIAYNQSVCNEVKNCGIWMYDLNTKEETHLQRYAQFPAWLGEDELVFLRQASNGLDKDIGDTVLTYSILGQKTRVLTVLNLQNIYNSNLKTSVDHSSIAFISYGDIAGQGVQLYTLSKNGTDLKKITTDGTTGFSFSPDGNFVYVNFDWIRVNESKGTLWTMKANGTDKKPITYNHYKSR